MVALLCLNSTCDPGRRQVQVFARRVLERRDLPIPKQAILTDCLFQHPGQVRTGSVTPYPNPSSRCCFVRLQAAAVVCEKEKCGPAVSPLHTSHTARFPPMSRHSIEKNEKAEDHDNAT